MNIENVTIEVGFKSVDRAKDVYNAHAELVATLLEHFQGEVPPAIAEAAMKVTNEIRQSLEINALTKPEPARHPNGVG